MNVKLAQLYQEMRGLRARLTAAQTEVEATIHTSTDAKEQADIAYALREIEKLADEISKVCRISGELAQRMACLIATASDCTTIRTDYVTASTDMKPVVTIPRRSSDPEGFAKLMTYLKVPTELWENGESVAMQPHWPGMIELLARRQMEGLPLPPGIDPNKTYPKYSLILRGKRPPSDALAESPAAPSVF